MTGLTAPRERTVWLGRALAGPLLGVRGRVILVALVALVPAALLFLGHIADQRRQLVVDAGDRVLRIARAWAREHDELVHDAGALVTTIAHAPPIADCTAGLQSHARDFDWTNPIGIIDSTGRLLCASGTETQGLAGVDPAFLDDLFDSRSVEVSEFKTAADGRPHAYVGRRLPGQPGDAERAVITELQLADIEARTAPVANGVDYKVIVLNRDKTILTSWPAGNTIETRLGPSHPMYEMINVGTEGTASGRGDDGIASVFAFTQLPQTGAKVLVAIPQGVVLGPEAAAVDRLAVELGAVAFMAMLCAWLIAELSVVRWVRLLGRSAEALGRGELDRRIDIPAHAGEFAALATRFNAMAANLAARHREIEAASHAVKAANEALEQRVAERTAALVAAQSELVQKERLSAIGELTATVAHELHNPLGAIKNTVYSLQHLARAHGLDIGDRLGRIERSIRRCNDIIGDLLDFSRTRAAHRRACRLDRLLGDMLDDLEPNPRISVVRALQASDTTAMLDPDLFRRAIGKVLDNALHAADGTGGSVTVASRVEDEAIVVEIADTGPGIEAHNLARVFDPLFSTKSFGTGLGLTVAKRIIEQHDGAIAIVCPPPRGTCVTIRLPLPAAQEQRRAAAA